MEKQLVIIGIIAILVCVGFSGCTSNPLDSERNKFIGTWKGTDNSMYTPIEITFIFFSDGTLTASVWGATGTYEIKDGKLVMTFSESQLVFSYLFSNGGNTLSITDISGQSTMVFTKQ